MIAERVRLPRKLAKSVSNGVLAETGRLNPIGAVGITLNLQPLHRVTMTLAENDLPMAMHDLVEVYNHNGSVGVYRVVKISNTYRKERKIDLSHGLDVFSDSTFSGIEKYSGTVAGFLQKIVDAQTQTIGGVKYWQLGTCADTHYWEKDIKYDNLMSCITEIAKEEEDYMFTFDQSTFPWTLNFVARDSTVLSEFRLNRNTSSCSITMDDSDLCTRLYLSVSKESEDSAGYGTYWDDGYYVYNDTAAQASWGIVCKTAGVDQSVSAPDVDRDTWANQYFSRHNSPAVQISIDGVELNQHTGESIDEMHLGRICRVALPEYDPNVFNERIITVKYSDALRAPAKISVTLANKRITSEDAFAEIHDTASSASKTAKSGGKSSHNEATYWRKEIADTANGLYARIEMTASYIRSEVADTANGLNSKIEQTASYIRAEVSDTANGLDSKIEQTASYIRSKVNDTANGLSSRIDQNASAIALRVIKGDVATQLAVEAGNVSVSGGNLIVDGMVTAAAVQAAIGNITLLNVTGINASASISVANNVVASDFKVGEKSITNAIGYLRINQSGDTYTLQQRQILSDTWYDVGSFSRATTLSGTWSGGTLTVTASPQGTTQTFGLMDNTSARTTWDDDKTAKVKVYATLGGGETAYDTGKVLTVDATHAFEAGENQFDLVDITLEGAEANNYYQTIDTGGTLYYTADTSVYVYDEGSKETYYDIGSNKSVYTRSATGGGGAYGGSNYTHYIKYQGNYKDVGTGWYTTSSVSVSKVEVYPTTNGRWITPTGKSSLRLTGPLTRYGKGTRYNKNQYYTKS